MKSFHSFLFTSFIILVFFSGMLIVLNDVPTDNLNNDSILLVYTLNEEFDEVDIDELNVSQVELGTQDVDAFSAEFYSASTDSKKKQGVMDTMKNMPNLFRYTVGQEDSFTWFWERALWYFVALIALIGFVILFRREVF